MPRIAGIDLPAEKRVDIGLTTIYGVGRSNVTQILSVANVKADKKIKELSDEEVVRLQKAVDTTFKVEGDLRKEILESVKRLKQIGSFRGKRHSAGLPARGQRTRSNARTKRGRRMTIGALKKDDLLKKQKAEAEKAKTK
jgi:small subunit ribosomal protein S13